MAGEGNSPKMQVVGPVLGLYSDLGSQYLSPERARIEALQYRIRIDPNGDITYEMPPVTMVSNYIFALRKIVGFALNEASIGPAAALIDFNLGEQGRSFTLFKRPISFAALLKQPMEWDGAYLTLPGTVLECTWAIDTTRWPSLVAAPREIGIQLLGELVRPAGMPAEGI